MIALRDASLDDARIGFALKRSLGPAVRRNRLRRRLRAACRATEAEVGIPPGLYLFSGRPDGMTVSFEAIRLDVRRLIASEVADVG